MLNYEWSKWIITNRLKLIIISLVMVITAMVGKREIFTIMSLSGQIENTDTLTIADYLMGLFNAPQMFMFFIFPILFSILVANLLTSDLNKNALFNTLTRYNNRKEYILTKFKLLFIISIIFTCMIVIISIIVWWILGVPFKGTMHHYIFIEANLSQRSTYVIIFNIFIRFILGLLMIGALTLFISLLFNNASLSVGVIIIMGFLHNAFYVTTSLGIVLLPFTQYIYGLQNLYAPFGIPISFFNSVYSLIYMITSILVLFYLSIRRFKSINM